MANTDCMKRIEKSREKQTKLECVRRKLARDHEQAEQQQNIIHTYGKQESSKLCKCGSTYHLQTTSKDCPFRKVRVARMYRETTFWTTVVVMGRIPLTSLVRVVVMSLLRAVVTMQPLGVYVKRVSLW